MAFDETKIERLCERARASAWTLADVEWTKIALRDVAPTIRRALGSVYANVLEAEKIGLGMIERAHSLAPEGALREFAALQLRDEALHVEFFARVTDQLMPEATPSPWLRDLHAEVRAVQDFDELMVHGQIVERAAGAFIAQNARNAQATAPRRVRIAGSDGTSALLDHVVRFVGRDEARHVAFGSVYLDGRFRDAAATEVTRLSLRARQSCELVRRTFADLSAACACLGLSRSVLLASLWESQRAPLQRMGLDIGDAPVAPGGAA
jgi:hypothetical protein